MDAGRPKRISDALSLVTTNSCLLGGDLTATRGDLDDPWPMADAPRSLAELLAHPTTQFFYARAQKGNSRARAARLTLGRHLAGCGCSWSTARCKACTSQLASAARPSWWLGGSRWALSCLVGMKAQSHRSLVMSPQPLLARSWLSRRAPAHELCAKQQLRLQRWPERQAVAASRSGPR